MLKEYKTAFKSLMKKMSKLTMKRGVAMLLALSIMLVAVPTIAITAIYAEGSIEVGQLSDGETTASSIDETEPTTPAAETTTTETDDASTTAEVETTTTAAIDEPSATAEVTTTTSSVIENTETTKTNNIRTANYGRLQITCTSSGFVDLLIVSSGQIYVDWGDGIPVECVSYESCSGNPVGTIKVYSTGDITSFCCNSSLTSIDVSGATALTSLQLPFSGISELDISKNTALTELSCDYCQISTLDVSNNTSLEYLSCNSNNLSSLDISNNTKLTHLSTQNNALSNLNVENNTFLESLLCDYNSLSSLNTSNNTLLKTLTVSANNITSLDLSSNTILTELNCDFNKISVLDLSNNPNLERLQCIENNITDLKINENSPLGFVYCSFNKLLFSTMPKIITQTTEKDYGVQKNLEISNSVSINTGIDLSSEYTINGTKTVYTWHNAADDSVVTPTTSESGVFTFGDDFAGKTLYCKMTNAEFPDLTLTTTMVKVQGDLGAPKIILTTAMPIGSEMSLYVLIDYGSIYVDWGDGFIKEYSSGVAVKGESTYPVTPRPIEEVSGNTIKVYADSKLTFFICSGNELTDIDLSGCPELTHIECEDNMLTSLDVSGNPELDGLAFGSNNISEIDISNNTKLTLFRSNDNPLTALDVSNNPGITLLECVNNKLAELDVSNSEALIFLDCKNNMISELDTAELANLKVVNCENNNLKYSTMGTNIAICKDENLIPTYAPQAEVTISESVNAYSDFADLSSEYDIDGTKTVYTWYDAANGSAVTPTTSENGTFTFGKDFAGKTLYCEMTNAKFPELTLTTTEVTVEESFEVVDNNDYIGEAEPSDDIVVEDENGNEINLGNVRLIIGNVAENNKKTVREAIEAYNKEFKATDNNHAMYDIHLETDKGVKVEIVDGHIKIRLHYPDNLGAECTDYTYHLYHIKDDGTVEEIVIDAKPNGIWFYADDFSPYVLTYEIKDTTTTTTTTSSSTSATTTTSTKSTVAGSSDTNGKGPKTGDDTLSTVVAITLNLMLVMMLLIVLGFRWHQKFHQSTVVLTAGAEGHADITDSELLVDDDEISMK